MQAWNAQQMWNTQMIAQQQLAAQQAVFAQGANVYSPFSGSLANPYSPAGIGYGVSAANPYQPGGGIASPYGPYGLGNYGTPYASSPGVGIGVALSGSADVMRAYSGVVTAQEDARIKRELSYQERIRTKKASFDLDQYIKANTPTYTQELARVTKSTLIRIQNNSLPGEITNGKALNFMLDDLRKFPNKKIGLEPLQLTETVLTHLNVSKNTFGIGLLRDGGRVSWPAALQDQMSVNKRQELDKQIKSMVEDAFRGRLDNNVVKDVRNEIDKMRDALISKANEIPTGPYLDAKRFLQEFDEATIALQRDEAQRQAKFQRHIEGGRSVQEVVDYMIANGLRFAPATANDEAAYRAFHSALTRYDVAMNSDTGDKE